MLNPNQNCLGLVGSVTGTYAAVGVLRWKTSLHREPLVLQTPPSSGMQEALLSKQPLQTAKLGLPIPSCSAAASSAASLEGHGRCELTFRSMSRPIASFGVVYSSFTSCKGKELGWELGSSAESFVGSATLCFSLWLVSTALSADLNMGHEFVMYVYLVV